MIISSNRSPISKLNYREKNSWKSVWRNSSIRTKNSGRKMSGCNKSTRKRSLKSRIANMKTLNYKTRWWIVGLSQRKYSNSNRFSNKNSTKTSQSEASSCNVNWHSRNAKTLSKSLSMQTQRLISSTKNWIDKATFLETEAMNSTNGESSAKSSNLTTITSLTLRTKLKN